MKILDNFLVSILTMMLVITLFSNIPINVSANVPPVADAGGPYTGFEGSNITFNASNSYDPDGDVLYFNWDIDGDGVFEKRLWDEDPTFTWMWVDDYFGYVTVSVTTNFTFFVEDTTTVTVYNVAPTITSLTGLPFDPIDTGTTLEIDCSFTDPGILDTHSAVFDWGDGTITNGTVNEVNGSGTANNIHTYTTAGVYTFKLTIIDKDGGLDTEIYQYIVVYDQSDPTSGFVTGGGWIDSPEGAFKDDANIAGKANFGFVSKYKKGQLTPTGNTEFQFRMADINFHSKDYDWLIVAGSKAVFKGTGTINNAGDFGFMIFAIDEELTQSTEIDVFRIKIWDIDDGDRIIYDNNIDEVGTELGGGQIVIHKM